MAKEPTTYTISELANLLGRGTGNVYKQLADGQIPGRKVGSKYVILRDEIQRWLDTTGSVPPADPPPIKIKAPYQRVRSNSKMRYTEAFLVSVPEFARISGMGYSYLRKLLAEGVVPGVRVIEGRTWIIRERGLEWLAGEAAAKPGENGKVHDTD